MRVILQNVGCTYPGQKTPALAGISATIEPGKMIALLGANGSGKSTLARIAAGILEPTQGEARWEGFRAAGDWNGVGILLQNADDQMLASSVEREIALGLENLAVPPPEMRGRVQAIMQDFNLNSLAQRSPETLSDGEKQLTALAALLVMEPGLLILDEASAYLDPVWRGRVLRKARAQASRRGVLWVTTQAEEASAADEVWLLASGRIAFKGPSPEVLTPANLDLCRVE